MDGLTAVRERVVAAAERAGRDPGSVTLVAVSKGRSLDEIRACYDAGHRDFGENRVGELIEKAVAAPPDIRWHFVGTLQSNKAQLVRPVVTLLHSMTGGRLLRRWAADEPGSAPPVLIQVNVSDDPAKHGVDPEETENVLARAREIGLDVRGLMTITRRADLDRTRSWFRTLAESARSLGLRDVSMGMTDDFEVAVEEGATLIRVGRAIFDPPSRR